MYCPYSLQLCWLNPKKTECIWKKLDHQYPDSKIHRANMGPTWGWQDPGGIHVVPMNLAIRVTMIFTKFCLEYPCRNSSRQSLHRVCWCLGFLCCQDISRHDFDGRLSCLHCEWLSCNYFRLKVCNGTKYENIFTFLSNNSGCYGWKGTMKSTVLLTQLLNVRHCSKSFHSLWPSDIIWQQIFQLTLAEVIASCLTAPSHYLNKCSFIKSVLCHSPESDSRRSIHKLNPYVCRINF